VRAPPSSRLPGSVPLDVAGGVGVPVFRPTLSGRRRVEPRSTAIASAIGSPPPTLPELLVIDKGVRPHHVQVRAGIVAGGSAMRRAVARLTGASGLLAGPGSLAAQVAGLADSLSQVLGEAASLGMVVPPPISNSVHDLRGWACRIDQGMAGQPVAVDAARLLGYLRGLPDHQLLALLADLPWARLDVLLDAVNATKSLTPHPHPRPRP
jgi:hypothetical protein